MNSSARSPIRPAAVAGQFYPSRVDELVESIDRYLDDARGPALAAPPPALVAPHAGYVYSGPVAGSAFAPWRAVGFSPRRVILLGPNHYLPVHGAALPSCSAFSTPLGNVPLATAICRELLELPFVTLDAAAHAPEHALEVELPFLQRLFGEIEIVPLLVGDLAPERVAELLAVCWSGPESVVVVSSDLSHYLPYEAAREIDGYTAGQLRDRRGPIEPNQACGARAINGLLLEARRRGLAGRVLDLRNSGDTAGPRDQVVGYGAFAFDHAN